MRIETDRLLLIPASIEHVRAEADDRAQLPSRLGADVPAGWPPPLNDEQSMRWTLDYLSAHPDAEGWAMWYFLLRRGGEPPLAIGCGGFTGLPTADGACEVGYSVMEAHQRRGYGSEATRALIDWAFSHASVSRVIAHTLPILKPSIRVLEKCGFSFVGDGEEEGTIRFELQRP